MILKNARVFLAWVNLCGNCKGNFLDYFGLSDIFDLPEVIYNIDKNLKKNIYVCENIEFRNFLKYFNIEPSSMEKQIIKTYNSLNLIKKHNK